MDSIDRMIIVILRKDARTPLTTIASRVRLSKAAVQRRIANLLQYGAIKRFTVETDELQCTRAITQISVDPFYPTFAVSAKLVKVEGVKSIYEVAGSYDIVALVERKSMDLLTKSVEGIRAIKGVRNTNTSIVLRDGKSI